MLYNNLDNRVRYRAAVTDEMKEMPLSNGMYGFYLYTHDKRPGWTNIKEIGYEFKSIDKLLQTVGKW